MINTIEINSESIQIQNHAHFKRILKEGHVKLETITLAHNMRGGRLRVGMVRSIRKADTTGVYLVEAGDESQGSFLGYDKASDWVFNGNIAKNITIGYSYKLIGG
jgi:2',3'-cyclic-nucleotide 2'-phosphodiesterase (5'-nucleotidase family)